MDSIDAALESLRLQDKPNISATAREHNIDRSTLSRQFNSTAQSAEIKAQNQCLITPAQEKELVQYINKLSETGLPPTPAMVCNFVFDIIKKRPGKGWSQRFCKRWKDTLDSRYLKAIDASRQKADFYWSYKLYFTLIKQKIDQYDIQAHNIYNMDEKGFMIGHLTKAKRIFTKAAFQKGRLLGNNQDGNREWITVIATICADGTWLPPSIIYKATTGNIQDSWVQDFDALDY